MGLDMVFGLLEAADPVVVIWTATFALALIFFLISSATTRLGGSATANNAGQQQRRGLAGGGGRGQQGHSPTAAAAAGGQRGPAAAAAAYRGRSVKVVIATEGLVLTEGGKKLAPGAKEALASLASKKADLYLVTEVSSDADVAAAEAAMGEVTIKAGDGGGGQGEEGGGFVQAHKLLFVEKRSSKVSIARQIEPHIYLDADDVTCQELRRFLPRVTHLKSNATIPELVL